MNTHQKMSARGGIARRDGMTPEQRSESARKAGLASAAKRLASKRPNPNSKPMFPGPDLHMIPRKAVGLFRPLVKKTTGAFGSKNVRLIKRAK